ncbi:Casein kinase II subunit beta-2 [Lachnellula hyalina]|uniref:Casein kinase II subunit beta n=1 Tax=Lachnellula hyalina TaxID=1316788 RepID=A0A8H8R131_9HELO|nr:Casein kinase II subunit beta-2 [Lachnellula hyalina]TVY26548.1 Casein kinase II subunit beta-2 [Lachnellula hyalina]
MDDFNSETDSDYTSYWRDWVSRNLFIQLCARRARFPGWYSTSSRCLKKEKGSGGRLAGVLLGDAMEFCALAPLRTTPHPSTKSFEATHTRHVRTEGTEHQKGIVIDAKDLRQDHPLAFWWNSGRLQVPKLRKLLWSCFPNLTRRLHPILLSMDSPPPREWFPGNAEACDSLSHQHLPQLGSMLPHPLRNIGNLASKFHRTFISSRGNEYFCEIDEDYLTDRFNLTGLNTEVQYYQYALDLVTDVFDLDCDDEMRETIEKSARHLYGLVHARYIVTTRGLAKMLDKYKKAEFGKCPRVMCKSHPLLPMGQADNPNLKAVKLYCARCEDIYNPKSSRHSVIDGAYFGTSFHNIIFQVYPALIPTKSSERYVPRIYGFKVHAPATLIRWQSSEKDDMRKRLRKLEIDSGFKDDEEDVEAEDSEEEEEEEVDMDVIENGAIEGGELKV